MTKAISAKPVSSTIRKNTKTLILRERVYAYLRRRRGLGATDEEISHALNMSGNTARPRRIELEQMGKVHHNGSFRPTMSGRNAMIWTAVR